MSYYMLNTSKVMTWHRNFNLITLADNIREDLFQFLSSSLSLLLLIIDKFKIKSFILDEFCECITKNYINLIKGNKKERLCLNEKKNKYFLHLFPPSFYSYQILR